MYDDNVGSLKMPAKFYIRKRVKLVVELDQFKYTLSTYEKPLVEVRDSL